MAEHFDLPVATSGVTDVDGYTRFKDVFVLMRDGTKLCADIFLPNSSLQNGSKAPVLASLGPYGKDINSSVFGLPRTDIYTEMYKNIEPKGEDSVFEVVDPILWVSHPKHQGVQLWSLNKR
jgi:hypothetical protein